MKLRRTCLKRQVCVKHACMTAGSIAILRSRRRHRSETVERVARGRIPSGRAATRMPCLRERRRSARLPPRPDAERYDHTVRDLMFPMGDTAVGIGSHSFALESPKGRFSPREAPSAAAARSMNTGSRNRDPMPSSTPAPFPHTMRGRPDRRSASAVPVLTGGAGARRGGTGPVRVCVETRSIGVKPRGASVPRGGGGGHTDTPPGWWRWDTFRQRGSVVVMRGARRGGTGPVRVCVETRSIGVKPRGASVPRGGGGGHTDTPPHQDGGGGILSGSGAV